jgi:hypothetical protein
MDPIKIIIDDRHRRSEDEPHEDEEIGRQQTIEAPV